MRRMNFPTGMNAIYSKSEIRKDFIAGTSRVILTVPFFS